IGTRPNIDLLKLAGVQCSRGVLVNEYLQTSDPHIFAIGEIAEFHEKLYGITAAAEQQADSLAKYMSGDWSSIYSGSVIMNILKFEDLDICSIGDIFVPANDVTYEEVVFTDLSLRYYKKCIVRHDRLIGAILIGDKSEFAEFRMMIEDRIELSEKRTELLRSQTGKQEVIGRLVCSCNHVGAGNLQEAINAGCADFNELCNETGAGLGCGSCKPEVMDIFKERQKKGKNATEFTTYTY
ncbi:MAG: FAD-dependent oxidoreductase, partial [Saprospiraceae bacterium]|nr:FAD-dependent oxidoreductase [Saprospiraceae bacterium]